MTHPNGDHTRQRKARQRRLENTRERLQREQARAPRHVQALDEALQELGLPETVAEAVQWRLQAQQKRLSNIVGLMCPPFLGAAATTSCAGCVAGTRTCPAVSWAPGPRASGSDGCSA